MGTTRTALEAGSCDFRYVVAIEGHSELLTNATAAQAITAWSGTDWSAAIEGLSVDIQHEQRMEPDNPAGSMGSCTLWMLNESFGVTVAKRAAGTESYLSDTIDRNDTTIPLLTAASFASSGTVFIGTEAITYSGKSATTLTGATRGMWSPFAVYGGTRFAHHHRVGQDANSVNLQPIVSTLPRIWLGKYVAVYLHRMVGGVLDVVAQAELIFAGRLREIRDDQNTGCVVVQVRSIIEDALDRIIGSSLWGGTTGDGLYLSAGMEFDFVDKKITISGGNATVADGVATTLAVVASGAVAPNQINAGTYTHGSLCTALSTWLAGNSGGLEGTYSIASPVTTTGDRLVTKVYWELTGNVVTWTLIVPHSVALFLGFDVGDAASGQVGFSKGNNATGIRESENSPTGAVIPIIGSASSRFSTTTTTGTFVDQYASLPFSIRPADADSLEWGLFVVDDSRMVLAAKSGDDLLYVQPWYGIGSVGNIGAKQQLAGDDQLASLVFPLGGGVPVRQIFAFEYDFLDLLYYLLSSTGTAGYNHPAYDALPFGGGAALPWSLLNDPGVTLRRGSVVVIVDKPKKLRDIVEADLCFRWSFITWRNGTIQFNSWRQPSTTQAVYTLDSSNKGEPAGHIANQRTSTTDTDAWRKEAVKIEYNRAIGSLGIDDKYQNSVMFEDRVAVDDAGGATKVHTISLPNTFSNFAATGDLVETLLPKYLALMPMISRGGYLVERSIDPRYFWRIGIGDTVLFSDGFVRDPATGTRTIADRPALVVKHSFSLGGKLPGSDATNPMGGRVTLFYTEADSARTGAAYVPSADVDNTQTNGGYNAGTLTLTTYAHRYSESSESSDALNLAIGDKIKIIERDPALAASPLVWERVVASVTATTVVTTVALSSPAWDATKKYRIVYDDYDVAVTGQKTYAFQADDADGRIQNLAGPYLYGSGTPAATYTANTSTEIELVPAASYADGAGRDVGTEQALIRQIDNFIDYKSATQCPALTSTVWSNTTATGTNYLLVAYFPIFLGYDVGSSSLTRYISLAPWAYSTDGTSTKIRITLCRDRPSGASLVNHTRGVVYHSAEWTGITSTTPGALSAKTVVAGVKHPASGQAYVMIELGYKCATRGLARFVEGARIPA